MTVRRSNFAFVERVIFALWIVPNPLGYIITTLPRSREKNLTGLFITTLIGALIIYFILFGAPEISLKVAVSALVGMLVMLTIFAVIRRLRLMSR